MATLTEKAELFNELLADAADLDGVALSALTTAQRWKLLALLGASLGWVGPGKVVELPPAIVIPAPAAAPSADGPKRPAARKPRKRKGK